MTNIDTGIQGAKRQSFHASSPRDALKRLIEQHPNASDRELLELFEEAVLERADLLSPIIEYWFANNHRSLKTKKPPVERRSRAEEQAAVVEAATIMKAAAVKIVLMDLPLPNGKQLKDSTGRECAKAGGWFAKIAKRVGTKQIVGKVLSEADVQKMYRG